MWCEDSTPVITRYSFPDFTGYTVFAQENVCAYKKYTLKSSELLGNGVRSSLSSGSGTKLLVLNAHLSCTLRLLPLRSFYGRKQTAEGRCEGRCSAFGGTASPTPCPGYLPSFPSQANTLNQLCKDNGYTQYYSPLCKAQK